MIVGFNGFLATLDFMDYLLIIFNVVIVMITIKEIDIDNRQKNNIILAVFFGTLLTYYIGITIHLNISILKGYISYNPLLVWPIYGLTINSGFKMGQSYKQMFKRSLSMAGIILGIVTIFAII